MSVKFPVVDYKRVIKFFEKHGYVFKRQQGSHMILEKDGVDEPLTVPKKKEVRIGTILSNLRRAGIGKEEFIEEVAKK